MANPQNLKPFTGADDPRRMNGKPKGTKHISTWIQELLNDEEFEALLPDPRDGWKEYKGAPLRAITRVMAIKAMQGDVKAFEALAKHGWTQKLDVKLEGEVTHKYEDLPDDELERIIQARKDRAA